MTLKPGLQLVGIDLLREWDRNPREIVPERFESLKRSLEADPELAKARPVIATPEGVVFAGNMRLRAQRDLGRLEIWSFVMEADEQRMIEIGMRDNNEYGEWVPDELRVLVSEYKERGGDLDMLGFDDEALKTLLSDAPSPPTGDAPVDPPPADQWAVVVSCEDEVAQAALIERLEDEGYECRALL